MLHQGCPEGETQSYDKTQYYISPLIVVQDTIAIPWAVNIVTLCTPAFLSDRKDFVPDSKLSIYSVYSSISYIMQTLVFHLLQRNQQGGCM